MECFDYAVIGGGIAGASFAARAAAHASVVVLEQEIAPGYHATGRSAALFSSLIGDTLIGAVTRASQDFFERPPQGFCTQALLQPRTALHLGGETAEPLANELARRPGTQRMETKDALARVPILRAQAAQQVVIEADASDIDVNELHRGFINQTRAMGSSWLNQARVTRLDHRTGHWLIQAGEHRLSAKTIVNAAGAWADELATMAGCRRRNLQALRRTAVLVQPPVGLAITRWPAVIALDESFYFKPDAGCLLVSPADEIPSPPCDAQAEEFDVALAIDRLESATTVQVKRIQQRWAGLRTFAPDRLPLIGFDDEVPDFFWLAGQGGYGVQTSPALSEFAAALALDRPLSAKLLDYGLSSREIFSPSRYLASMQQTIPLLETSPTMDICQ